MAADLRCGARGWRLQYARARIVHAAATVGVDVIDVPYLDLEDRDGMLREANLAAELGLHRQGCDSP